MIPNNVLAVLESIVVSLIDTSWGVLERSNEWLFPDELSYDYDGTS